MRPLIRVFAIAGVVILAGPAWYWACSWVETAGLGAAHFSRAAWLGADPQPRPAQADMVRSLVLEHGLVGMRREAVVRLLGEPDRTRCRAGATELSYGLGWGRGYGFGEAGSLAIWIGRDERVARWEVVRQ